MDSIVTILTGVISLLIPVLTELLPKKFVRKLTGRKEQSDATYGGRLTELIANLTKSTTEVDKILNELENVTKAREESLKKAESELLALEQKEKEIKERVIALENTPLEAVKHFAELTKGGEKRSAKRDYWLFALGVIVSTAIAILLKILGLG